MEKLLQLYTLTDILFFTVVLACAIKGIITFSDWAVLRIKQVFDKEYQQKADKADVMQELRQNNQMICALQKEQLALCQSLSQLSDKVDRLVGSDKDALKSFLTKEHHFFCYEQGWIDDYSLECCEKRFTHYQEEGGNSFIEHFMDELRALPKQPPQMKSDLTKDKK